MVPGAADWSSGHRVVRRTEHGDRAPALRFGPLLRSPSVALRRPPAQRKHGHPPRHGPPLRGRSESLRGRGASDAGHSPCVGHSNGTLSLPQPLMGTRIIV